MRACGKPEVQGTTMHECSSGSYVYMIEWRNPERSKRWLTYGRTFPSIQVARQTKGRLESWRAAHKESHEYRICRYRRDEVVEVEG